MARAFTLEELDFQRRDPEQRIVPYSSFEEPEDSLGVGGVLKDLALSPLRGVEAAAQDLYGLADAATGDSLRDWDARFLGESRTIVGGLIEGAVNFGIGFIPAFGALGKVSALSKATKGARAARALTAGAVADFALFDEHEARLSDLLQKLPALEGNAVLEFLESDQEDSVLEGRLKNALEGATIGQAADLVFLGLKSLRAARKARAAGADPRATQEAVESAVAKEEFDQAFDDFAEPNTLAERTPGPESPGDLQAAREGDLPGPTDRVKPLENQALGEGSTTEGRAQILKHLGLDDTKAREVLNRVMQRKAEGLDPGVNPRNLSADELLEQHLTRGDLNLRHWKPGEELQLLRSMEELFRGTMEADVPTLGRPQSFEEQIARSSDELQSMLQVRNETHMEVMLRRGIQDDNLQLARINARARAWKTVTQVLAKDVHELAEVASLGGAEDLLRFKERASFLADMMAGTKGLLSEQGRGLGANRINTEALMGNAEAIARAAEEAGGEGALRRLAEQFKTAYGDGGPQGIAAVTRLAENQRGNRFLRVINEYYINSILSGGTTFAVNAGSGVVASLYRPLEDLIGGAAMGRADLVQDSVQEIVGMLKAIPESFLWGKKVLKADEARLDPRAQMFEGDRMQAITSKNLGTEADSLMGQGINFIGSTIRMPGRLLMATDEVVKQMNYRGVAYSRLMREGKKAGLSGEALAKHVQDRMDILIDQGQRLSTERAYREGLEAAAARQKELSETWTREEVHQFARQKGEAFFQQEGMDSLSTIANEALTRAREVTFTTPLRPGSVSAFVSNLTNQHPIFKLIAPFIRTPVNLAGFAFRRSGVPDATNVITTQLRTMYAQRSFKLAKLGDVDLDRITNRTVQEMTETGRFKTSTPGRGQAAVLGRMGASIGMVGYFGHKVALGEITGAGPADPEQRALLAQTGWQPYSFRTAEGYVSYRRVDPFATLIGTVADFLEAGRYSEESDQDAIDTVSMAMVSALAQNFTNKTYLQGISNLVGILEDPRRNTKSFVQQSLGGFAPSLFAQSLLATGDPFLRDHQSVAQGSQIIQDTEDGFPLLRQALNALRARIPGLSRDLAPSRNLFGEPIRRQQALGAAENPVLDMIVPIAYREVSDDVVNQELANLRHGFTTPKKVHRGLDLQDFRSDQGQTAFDRYSQLHGEVVLGGRTMREAMRKLIQSAEYQKLDPVPVPGFDSPRVTLLSGIIQDYRREAWRQTLREFPDLQRAERDATRARRISKKGLF